MNPARLRLLWWIVCLAAAVPFARVWVLGYLDALTANPVEFVTRDTGAWTLIFLCITLAASPQRWLTGQAWWLRLRRMLGLWTFFYACVHLVTWVWFDQWFDLRAMWADIVKRPFITVGFLAVVLMLPLALTSSNFAMRSLGRRWGALHRLVYLVAPLGVLHFWWHKAAKNDLAEPAVYALIVLVLLAWRVWRAVQQRRPSSVPEAEPDGRETGVPGSVSGAPRSKSGQRYIDRRVMNNS